MIFSSIDRDLFWANLLDADPVALAAGLLMFFPIISGSVERWRWMLHDHADLPFRTGVKIFLAATSLNSVVPSKLGDLGKAVFLHNEGITDLERASNSVLLEKILDLAGLCTVFLFGFMVADVGDPVTRFVAAFSIAVLAGTGVYLTAHRPWNRLFPAAARMLGRWPTLRSILEDSPRFTSRRRTSIRAYRNSPSRSTSGFAPISSPLRAPCCLNYPTRSWSFPMGCTPGSPRLR